MGAICTYGLYKTGKGIREQKYVSLVSPPPMVEPVPKEPTVTDGSIFKSLLCGDCRGLEWWSCGIGLDWNGMGVKI